jgi:predicted transcriptional regulator
MEIIRADSSRTGGGKLNRSETVTVRLDPKLNYLCELAARAQRRTKSSFIEWAVAEALGSVILPDVKEQTDFDSFRDVTLKDWTSTLWQVDEPDRVISLALNAPALLNHEEQLVWRLVRENGFFWKGRHDKSTREWTWTPSEETIIRDRLRIQWPAILDVARGVLAPDKLPSWQKFEEDDLDDVPF